MSQKSFSDLAYVAKKKVTRKERFLQDILTNIPKLNAIDTADYPTPAKRPMNSCLDCGKTQQAFSIFTSDWQHALNNLVLYYNFADNVLEDSSEKHPHWLLWLCRFNADETS